MVCLGVLVPPFGKGRLGGDCQAVLAQGSLSKERAGRQALRGRGERLQSDFKSEWTEVLFANSRVYKFTKYR